VAEGFLRIDAIERLHVPRATLVAVRQALGASAGSAPVAGTTAVVAISPAWQIPGAEDAGVLEVQGGGLASGSNADHERGNAVVTSAGERIAAAASSTQLEPVGSTETSLTVLGPPLDDVGHNGGSTSSGAAPIASPQLPFELVRHGGEPWRLLANDVQSFQLVTSGIGALLAQKASLPTFAMILGLGCTPSAIAGSPEPC